MVADFIEESVSVLKRTPATLNSLLADLPQEWTEATEGPGTWSPYDIVGHLIHAETADWMPRLEIILEFGVSRPFDTFDREAQFAESQGNSRIRCVAPRKSRPLAKAKSSASAA